jgi:DNA modification methylase
MISSYDWILRAERIWHIPVGDSDYFNEGKIVDNNRLILDHCYVFHFTQARYGYYNSFEYLKGQPCSIFTDKLEKLDPNGFETGFSKELMKQSLLMSCPPEGKVLDPFCGSGSTGVTALSLGMSFLGIEIDETKISKIEQRLGKVSTTIVPQ